MQLHPLGQLLYKTIVEADASLNMRMVAMVGMCYKH